MRFFKPMNNALKGFRALAQDSFQLAPNMYTPRTDN